MSVRAVGISLPQRRYLLSTAGLAERALAGLLIGSCLLIPLLFSVAVDDSFALPKTNAARGVILAGCALLALAPVCWSRLRPGLIDLAIFVFVVLNVLAFAYSVDRAQSLNGERLQYQGLFAVLTYVGVFYLARVALGTAPRLRLACGSIVAGAFVASLYALAQKAGYDPIWSGLPDGRVVSTIGQPNALAAYLVLAVPLALSLLPAVKPPHRIALCVVAAMILLALLFTFSRAGYLALLAGLPVVLIPLFLLWRPKLRVIAIWAASAVVVAGLLIGLSQSARDNVARAWERGTSSGSSEQASTRLHMDLWSIGVAIANDHPALGTGQETFPLLVPSYRDKVLSRERAAAVAQYRPESPHNVYIATAAGAGYPALAAYVLIVAAIGGVVARRAWRGDLSKGRSMLFAALLAAIVAHMITDAFMTAELTSSWLFWLLLGAGFAVSEQDELARTLRD